MSDLQKIVVLCVVVIVGVGAYVLGTQIQNQDATKNNSSEQELPVNPDSNTEDTVEEPKEPNLEIPDDLPDEPVACTMDAKMCPDGSFVGRVAPNCNFAPCPKVKANGCTQTMIDMPCADIYEPVCATLEVQCITEPCDPIKQTVNNSCEVCKLNNLVSFTSGACVINEKPTPGKGEVICTDAMKSVDACTDVYQPVCGLVQVTCIQAPCPPVEETFSNGCNACSQGNVLSYTEGMCKKTY